MLIVPVLLLGCTGGDEAGSSTTSPPETMTTVEATTTTAAPDPFSIPEDPEDIDAAYVEAVLAELERINGDALRLAISEGLSPQARELLESTYTRELGGVLISVLVDESQQGFPGVRENPGDVRTTVTAVLVAQLDCVSADVVQDYSEVGPEPLSLMTRVELRPAVPGSPSNPTPWVYSLRQPAGGEIPFPEPCAAS